ncbi:hypothetical protein [Flavobacterium sp.]|uniref:hypothetical protein n=1 Tax=Flavobacterium sp. TaxID=239 RepID=UPI003D6A9A1E
MKIKLLYGLLVFFATTAMVFAQDEKTLMQKNRELKIYGVTDNFLIGNINPADLQTVQDANKTQEGSYVIISQIGNLNSSNVNVSSSNTELSIIQNGSNNVVDIDKSANQIKETIIQSGNDNYIKDSALYSNQNISQQFSQYGDNLSLYNYGSNSISDTMTIIQSGNQKSIIIINK